MTAPTHTRFVLHPSPVGEILIVVRDAAIVALHPLRGELDAEVESLSSALRTTVEPAAGDHDVTAAATARQLDEYFAGRRRAFDLALEWSLVRGFTRAALEAVRRIPYAETASYGEVAIDAGSPRAARAVGTACATTPFSIVVPVHRVVRADGSIGQYGGHPEDKAFLLALEQAAGE